MSQIPTAPPTPKPALSGAELLDAIDGERAAAHAVIDGLPARLRALLEANAPDADFDVLDKERAQAERQLARLDLRERSAVQAARREHEATLGAAWATQRHLFQAVAADLADEFNVPAPSAVDEAAVA